VDVLLLVRGGGSLEDLWAFNEETVARAIRACTVPVISGVGHEVDTTIADFAADLRAPTPTAAAEHATPDIQVWRRQLGGLAERLALALGAGLQRERRRVDELTGRLERLHPGRRLQDHSQRLDELAQRLEQAGARALQQRQQDWRALDARFRLAAQRIPDAAQRRLQRAEDLLHGLSPLAVLRRGYAIVARGDGAVVTEAAALRPGEALDVRVAQGRFGVIVRPDPAPGGD
jgi:exodeoxyribonuclease VII large subunit